MQAIRKPTLTDMALIVSIGMIWGTSFLAIKLAVREFSPTSIAAIRISIAFLVLFAVMRWRGLSLPRSPRLWAGISLVGIFNTSVPFFLVSWAEQSVDSGVAALLMGLGPLLTIIASHISTSDDKLTSSKIIAVIMGFGGVLIIAGADALAGLGDNLRGQLALIAASLCYVISGQFVRRYSQIQVESFTAAILLAGALSLMPWLAISASHADAHISPLPVMAVVYLGLVPTGLAYLLRFHLIRTVGNSYAVLGVYLVPVVGVLLGTILLDEPLTVTTLAALALILGALAWARWKA
ncbi:MAG TPA: EamA/RhaT family transporter [Chromatiales bacterium]|nr:EamA/RhaT family transporter [Chromatiales bacterium]